MLVVMAVEAEQFPVAAVLRVVVVVMVLVMDGEFPQFFPANSRPQRAQI